MFECDIYNKIIIFKKLIVQLDSG